MTVPMDMSQSALALVALAFNALLCLLIYLGKLKLDEIKDTLKENVAELRASLRDNGNKLSAINDRVLSAYVCKADCDRSSAEQWDAVSDVRNDITALKVRVARIEGKRDDDTKG